MGNFDDFDSFGGNSGFDSLDDGNDFGNLDFNDSSSSFDSFDTDGGSSSTSDSDFSGAFEDNSQQDNENKNNVKKQAIITAVVGLIGILLVIFIATKISSCSKKNNSNNKKPAVEATDRDGQDVNDIMSDNKVERPTSSTITDLSSNSWISIDKNQSVVFNTDYKELMFTVTSINHLAKKVDITGNLVVKTQLTGGISGLTGSYILDVPYSKGIKLVVGDSFTVKVQLGTYRGKTVVGEIVY